MQAKLKNIQMNNFILKKIISETLIKHVKEASYLSHVINVFQKNTRGDESLHAT